MRHHHLIQSQHVLMSKRLQQLDLPHSGNGEALLLALHLDLLESNHPPSSSMARFVDLTECSGAHMPKDDIQLLFGFFRYLWSRL